MHEMVDWRGLDISLALITVGDRYMSVFSADQIRHTRLQSPRLKRHYPPAPASLHILGLFHGSSKSSDRYLPEKDQTSRAR